MAAPALQMLTANRLTSGNVVYWHADGWVEAFIDGDVFAEKEKAERALDAAGGFVAKNLVVAPYLFEVREDGGKIWPVKEREVIRAAGPTVRKDLGKQAHGVAPTEPVHPADLALAAKVRKADDVSI